MSPTPSNDQPIGHARPRAALLIHHARRTSGHGPVTPDRATARISSDLWLEMAAWLAPVRTFCLGGDPPRYRESEAAVRSFAGYRCVEDETLPPDTVRLELTA